MKNSDPDWRWATAEGSREFDRIVDGLLTLREKIQWLEEAETLQERLCGRSEKGGGVESPSPDKPNPDG
jgi:hypothetical protein